MLPQSTSRRITVDAQQYQYVVSESGVTKDGIVPLAVTVQHQTNGALLRVAGLTTLRVPEEESKYYMGRTVKFSIAPRHITQIVRLAISRGWTPTSPGPPFVLDVANPDVFPLVVEE